MEREQLIHWGVLAFAVIFFCVGVYRTVEFREIGLSVAKRRFFTILHTIGCALFSSTLTLGVLAPDRRTLTFALFAGALVCLAPGQFTLGMAIKKRVSPRPSPKPRR